MCTESNLPQDAQRDAPKAKETPQEHDQIAFRGRFALLPQRGQTVTRRQVRKLLEREGS
jgi:hypothetical protein